MKRTGKQMDDLLDKVESGNASGGGVTIVNDEASLDANAKLGSLAVVAKEGSIGYLTVSESAININIQELVNTETGTIDVSPLPKVDGISILAPTGLLQSANPVTCMFVKEDSMITYDMWVVMTTSDSSGNVISIGYMPIMFGEGGVLASYSDGTWVINQEGVDAFNQILKSGEYYLVAQSMETGEFPTAEEFAILDSFVRLQTRVPSEADIYIKKDEWSKLLKKDLDKLLEIADKVKELSLSLRMKADKQEVLEINSETIVAEANKRYIVSLPNPSSLLIQFDPTSSDEPIAEYTFFLKNVSSLSFNYVVLWANGVLPELQPDIVYELSIVETVIDYRRLYKGVITPFESE